MRRVVIDSRGHGCRSDVSVSVKASKVRGWEMSSGWSRRGEGDLLCSGGPGNLKALFSCVIVEFFDYVVGPVLDSSFLVVNS